MADITAASAVVALTLLPIFATPQILQGFSADDVYDFDEVDPVETMMGVDGNLSGGFVYRSLTQRFVLMADSPSIAFFDTWYMQQVAGRTTYTANAITKIPAVGKKYVQTNGYLRGWKPIGAKKVLQPVPFRIEWNLVAPALG